MNKLILNTILGWLTLVLTLALIPFKPIRIVVPSDLKLWITSPTKLTTIQLPAIEALRICRKHNWHLADVVPISNELEEKKTISRKQALKILIYGNK